MLAEVLAQKRSEVAPESTPNEFFELFATEQILKDYDLSYDEIKPQEPAAVQKLAVAATIVSAPAARP